VLLGVYCLTSPRRASKIRSSAFWTSVAYRGTRVWRARTAAMYSVSAGVLTRAN
jgi:hypothetical protein